MQPNPRPPGGKSRATELQSDAHNFLDSFTWHETKTDKMSMIYDSFTYNLDQPKLLAPWTDNQLFLAAPVR